MDGMDNDALKNILRLIFFFLVKLITLQKIFGNYDVDITYSFLEDNIEPFSTP